MSSARNIILPLGYSIPAFESIDKHDGNDMYGYGHLLVSVYQYCNGLNYRFAKDVKTIQSHAIIAAESRKWIEFIKRQYENIGEECLYDISSIYSIIYSIAFNSPCNDQIVSKLQDRFFNAWLRGYRRISDIDMVRCLIFRWNRDKEDMKLSQRNCMLRIIRPWIDEFRTYGRFEGKDFYTTIQIASLLVWCDLSTILKDEKTFKQSIISRYIPHINLVDGRDGFLLKELYRFANSAIPRFYDIQDYTSVEPKLIEAMAASEDLNRFDRLGYLYDYKYLIRKISKEEIQPNI